MRFAPTGSTGRLLWRATLIGLVALVASGLLAYRELRSPARAWLRAIRDPDPQARQVAWTRLQRDREIRGLDRDETIAQVLGRLDDPDAETRLRAVSTLPALEPDPLRAIPRLVPRLADPDAEVRARAAQAIGDVVRRGVPGRDEALAALARALENPLAAVRAAAVASIGQVVYEGGRSMDPLRSGRSDDPALDVVARSLADPDVAVRVEAARVLACNDRGAEAVAMLVDYLRGQPVDLPPDRAADRAFLALMVLAIHSDEAAAYLGAEMALERDGYPDRPRDALAWAARQSPEARLRVKRLAVAALGPEDPSLRHNAGLLLHEIGSDQPALPVLIEALGDPSVDIRLRAVEALADIGVSDPSVLPALETATNDANPGVRERAAAAIEDIEWAEILSGLEGNP